VVEGPKVLEEGEAPPQCGIERWNRCVYHFVLL
jgi:hypothetical protein